MRIGVIGAGWLGGTVGQQWIKAGREVLGPGFRANTNLPKLRRLARPYGRRLILRNVRPSS